MAVTVEMLGKLERRIRLTLAAESISSEVESRLKNLSRTVRVAGFRPGKVPLSVIAKRYGGSVHHEVMSDKVGKAFAAAAAEARVRVAGMPRISEAEGASSSDLAFDATFEVYPEVQLGDLSAVAVERVSSEVTDAAVDKTLEILRKQRGNFTQRPLTDPAAEGDRVTIDFEGKIDGSAFDGGKAQDHQFVIGQGQMIAAFEAAVRGMKVGESKTFPLRFPDDYQGKDVAGKEADFLVTLKKVEVQHLPTVDEAFAKSLGVKDGTIEALRADIRRNLERELKFRVLARNKNAAMDALIKSVELDVPVSLVNAEARRLEEGARADLKRRGVKDADKLPIAPDVFMPQAERRVRLGLAVAELVRAHNLQAKPEQLQSHIEEMAQSYENPSELVRWYLSDRQRMAEVEAVVVENNVAALVLAKARVSDKLLPFDEVMAN
ncbi:MAG: trigger factor [Burkholderiaceae bacterium]|nr:trigger factor [Burkholderiaceae bacterium]MDH3460419.1 trigger factor [Burkholderiaceae bacterium]